MTSNISFSRGSFFQVRKQVQTRIKNKRVPKDFNYYAKKKNELNINKTTVTVIV